MINQQRLAENQEKQLFQGQVLEAANFSSVSYASADKKTDKWQYSYSIRILQFLSQHNTFVQLVLFNSVFFQLLPDPRGMHWDTEL